jgi:hypothetical protein
LAPDQVGHQRRKSIILAICPAVFNRHVVAIDIARLAQPLTERSRKIREQVRRFAIEKSDDWHCRLLRARRDGPSGRCA